MTQSNSGPQDGRSPFGALLLRLRTSRGLTQELLSQASKGGSISSRSITNYEARAENPQKWILPHRPVLRILSDALELDMVDQRSLVVAWNTSRKLRDARPIIQSQPDFVSAGRESAIQTTMDAWARARSGTPQVLFLSGIAGVGKSSLARHISDEIAASTNKVMISWGAASSWATDIEPYLSIRSATDRMLVKPQTSTTLPGNYPSRPTLGPREIERVIESIPQLAGAIISEQALRSMAKTYGAEYSDAIDASLATRSSTEAIGRQEEYSRLLVHFSQSWPVVIILEDLHWAGAQTATLLLHFAQQVQHLQDAPIMFICTFRNDDLQVDGPNGIHPFKRLLDSINHSSQVSTVTLNEAMSPTAGLAYVRGIVAQSPMVSGENADMLADYLYEQTSGHPLLTSELKRHLLETNALSQKSQGKWVFEPSKIPDKTPAAISSFVGQRLNRVSRRGKRILEIASVMNDVILPGILAETMEAEEEDILEIINDELVEIHQLLLPGPRLRLMQQSYATYRFPHALFREHIYNGMPETRRKRMHLAIAQAMERHYTEADTTALSEITSHFVMAEDWHSAQIAGYRLAQHAAYKLDWDLAGIWFAQAEELAIQAQDPQQLWRTRAARLAMLRGTGQHVDAVELGERILKIADVHSWPHTLGLTYHHLGEVYYDLGQVERAVDCLERAIDLHLQEEALDLAAAGMAMLSHSNHRLGKYDVARKYAQEALQLARQLKNSWVQPEAVLASANCETDLGFYEEAIQNYNLARELAVMVGKLQNQFIPAMNIGLCHTFMGNHRQAVDDLTALTREMNSLNIVRLTAPARLYLGFAYEGLQNWEAAAKAYQSASEIRRTRVAAPTLFDSLAGEMRVALQLGQEDLARKLLRKITDHLDQHGWEGMEYPLIVLLSVAKANAHFGDTATYESYIQRAHMQLMEHANMISDSESRHSYLHNVPFAVEIRSRYDEINAQARVR